MIHLEHLDKISQNTPIHRDKIFFKNCKIKKKLAKMILTKSLKEEKIQLKNMFNRILSTPILKAKYLKDYQHFHYQKVKILSWEETNQKKRP